MRSPSRAERELAAENALLKQRVQELEGLLADYKFVEKELKEKRELASIFFSSSLASMSITRLRDGILIDANKAWQDVTGLTRDEIIGRTTEELNIWVRNGDREHLFKELKEKGKVRNFESQVRHKSGGITDVLISMECIEMDGEQYMIGVAQEITERKRAEDKYRNLSNFLQVLFNTIPSPIFCKDINGMYVDCNNEFEVYTGFKRKDIIGKGVYDMYPRDVAAVYHEMDLALFRKPGRQIYEHPITYADGNRHDVVVNKATYMNEDGALAGLVGVMVDITERKRAEDELAKHREKLEQLVAERTHDLESKKKTLEEVNIALKVLLQHREEDRKDMEDRIVVNVRRLILPFAEKMKSTNLDERQLAYLGIIETNLNDITSSMIKKFNQYNLTPTEIEVISLIKEGKATKDIAGIIGIASSSVNTHRNNIRKKLGISKKAVNLRSHLQSFSQ